jgi:Lrp/AsnC family transcriptional regulator, regulator for asnA, asnC and gidA
MLNLDLLDKKILYELDLNARQSASSIAKKLKIAKETVNFRIKRLINNNIIKGFYAIIDTSLINRFFFKIFIKFNEINPNRRKEILDFFASHKNMSQVLLLEGNYDVQLFFLAKENNDLMKFMESLNNFCGKELQKKEILIINTMYRFNQKFLHNEKKNLISQVSNKVSNYNIDETSLKVLKEISKNSRISILDIAKNLNISSQLAQYHLKKLIKDKVIVSTHIAINYDKFNMQHYHLTFQVNDHRIINKIIQFFNQKNKSIFATKMIGHYDASAELIVNNNKELRGFVDELLTNFSEKINHLDIFLIYKEYELNLYPI